MHVSCLNAWRAAAPDARSAFRCDQCHYAYRVERTRVAAFLQSEAGALALAGALLTAFAGCCGAAALGAVRPDLRLKFYRWLRVSTVPGRASRGEEALVLGFAAVGLLVFALYAALEVGLARAQRRPTPALMLLAWVAAELRDARRGRALAVVGLWTASQGTYRSALQLARGLAQRVGDRVLEVQREPQ